MHLFLSTLYIIDIQYIALNVTEAAEKNIRKGSNTFIWYNSMNNCLQLNCFIQDMNIKKILLNLQVFLICMLSYCTGLLCRQNRLFLVQSGFSYFSGSLVSWCYRFLTRVYVTSLLES